MDSPSLDTPRQPVLSERVSETLDSQDAVLIAGFGSAVAADYAAFLSERSWGVTTLVATEEIRRLAVGPVRSMSMAECLDSSPEAARPESLVLFLSPQMSERECRELNDLLDSARTWPVRFIGIVSSFRVHLDDSAAIDAENDIRAMARQVCRRVVVFRPGHVLSRHSNASRWLERFAPWCPLVPRRIHSCFIEGSELFETIEKQRLAGGEVSGGEVGRAVGGREREFTLLGPNVAWRDMLSRRSATGQGHALTRAVATLLSWLFVGELIGLLLTILTRYLPKLRQWHVKTLTPRSLRELLSLCHQGNIGVVKVVGYNNGVHHFGHRYPGKTIVSTVLCHRTTFSGPGLLKADCGATIRNALDFLAERNRELYVVPNYSYVCVGTSFFVPIHGSAVDYSTVAATIQRVVLYDPEHDRIISAGRDDRNFIENVYNLQSRVVVLRVYLLTRPKSAYFVRHETLKNPSAGTILDILTDRDATNVELRQAQSTSANVKVSRYYTDRDNASSAALELPRDALGKLWDRLEENPITAYLMHAVGRHLVWHAELFFRPHEFEKFWETHASLPLRKIQLRAIRRDGLTHSPFRDEDCVSADLFMFRRNKDRFQDYLKSTLPTIRTNPGKHSN